MVGDETLIVLWARPGHMLRPAENFIREMKELSKRAGLHWDGTDIKYSVAADEGTYRPGVIIPFTGHGLEKPGGLVSNKVQHILVGQLQGVAAKTRNKGLRIVQILVKYVYWQSMD